MSMVRAQAVLPASEVGAAEADDEIALTYDERHRRRIRMTSGKGKDFLLDLPKATVLTDGDHLVLNDGSHVCVRASDERVADIHAGSPRALAMIAWHLGNRHWPTQVLDDALRIRYDHVLVEMVRGLGAAVTLRDAPFQPEGGAYAHDH